MYVAKIIRYGIILEASVFEKEWSEEMLSNNIVLIKKKNFLLRFFAYRWVNAEITKILFTKKQLEIIDE